MRGELSRTKRGAYFFVLDAFIAGIIIVSSLAIFFSNLVVSDNPAQSYVLAEDFLSLLEKTTVKNYGGLSIYEMRNSGMPVDPSLTLLELIVKLYSDSSVSGDDEWENMTILLKEVSVPVPKNNGIGYYVNDVPLYNITPGTITYETSRLSLSSRRIVVLRTDTTLNMYTIEVRMWR
ncbi:hypothetical protein GOV10_04265 [Candidatus Woesearchaeota archaeon]|nr:hypothetical protein [Candidatus Woesearchaeota archaeon]